MKIISNFNRLLEDSDIKTMNRINSPKNESAFLVQFDMTNNVVGAGIAPGHE